MESDDLLEFGETNLTMKEKIKSKITGDPHASAGEIFEGLIVKPEQKIKSAFKGAKKKVISKLPKKVKTLIPECECRGPNCFKCFPKEVVEEVLYNSEKPLQKRRNDRTILIVVDGTISGSLAYQYYLDKIMNRDFDALVFAYIVDLSEITDFFRPTVNINDVREGMKPIYDRFESYGKEFTTMAKDLGIPHKMVFHLSYSCGKEIVNTAIINKVNMIVLGDIGEGKNKRLLNETNNYVIEHAQLPVLCVPLPMMIGEDRDEIESGINMLND